MPVDPTPHVPSIAVTGATGALGGRVAELLAADGVTQRLLARTPSKAPHLAGSTIYPCAYGDREAARAALSGVQTLLMVSASESPNRLAEHRAFIRAASEAGVRHIVYTSFVGAAPDAIFTLARDHYATEEDIRSTPMTYTFLRNNMYLDFLATLPGGDNVIRAPAGNGRVAAIARADIARAAATILKSPLPHANRTYELSGPAALTFNEIAEVLTNATGTFVEYHDETVTEAYESRKAWPAPDWQYDAWVSTYTAIAAGIMGTVSDDVERITGHPPITLESFVQQNSSGQL